MTHRRDITLLFSTRIIRLFCYGFLSVILALYLAETGFDEKQIGLLFTFILLFCSLSLSLSFLLSVTV